MKTKLVIAGPCSAETETQTLNIARELSLISPDIIFRAGIWKPRTKPGAFEGHGTVALPWLVRVKQETGLKTATEIATAKHAEEALKHGIDLLWIGARTTVNPFSVQEIADALKGSKATVYIKNPTHPEVALWEGAVERLLKAGLTDLGLIHRGFKTASQSRFRNPPMWQLAIEMKLRYPNLPMICDPSHILGAREGLGAIADKAASLDYQGLMIETHTNPAEAWSDAQQQITPAELKTMLDALVWKIPEEEQGPLNELSQLRDRIDTIDEDILNLLSERMLVSEAIGSLKQKNNVTILQPGRWQEIVDKTLAKTQALNLSPEFIVRFLDAVHIESINHQNSVFKGYVQK